MPNICTIHADTIGKYLKENFAKETEHIQGFKKLQQYNDPTAHFRMVREEIKKAAQDGKTKLQFPTGETAMKIEGLGVNADNWLGETGRTSNRINVSDLSVGKEISRVGEQDKWIITDVLGDGKFKAVSKDLHGKIVNGEFAPKGISKKELFNKNSETFDISGKVDTNNPIYKFYEKEVQKYLKKFGGRRVVDDKGVSWIEIPITKEQGKAPVEAFGKIQISPLYAGAGLGLAGVVGAGAIKKKK